MGNRSATRQASALQLFSRVQEEQRHAREDRLTLAEDGLGPLLQRDYWGVIRDCRGTPAEVIDAVRAHLWDLAAPEMLEFRRVDGTKEPLEEGDELEVHIRFAGRFGIRLLNRGEQSFTIGTLEGHPEAGKVTIGAYRNPPGDVVMHARSRARSGSWLHYAGFLAGAEGMQANAWTELINRTAAAVGAGVIGFISAETRTVDPGPEDEGNLPTYRAEGG